MKIRKLFQLFGPPPHFSWDTMYERELKLRLNKTSTFKWAAAPRNPHEKNKTTAEPLSKEKDLKEIETHQKDVYLFDWAAPLIT